MYPWCKIWGQITRNRSWDNVPHPFWCQSASLSRPTANLDKKITETSGDEAVCN